MFGRPALRGHIVTAVFLFFGSAAPLVAEETTQRDTNSYAPSLGDMMVDIQLRHSKLWYASQAKNWRLADYELRQLSSSFDRVTKFYPDVPASALTETNKLANLIGKSVAAKDDAAFDISFDRMTAECNSCHRASDRTFIVIRKPTFPSPYSNQVFAPAQE